MHILHTLYRFATEARSVEVVDVVVLGVEQVGDLAAERERAWPSLWSSSPEKLMRWLWPPVDEAEPEHEADALQRAIPATPIP